MWILRIFCVEFLALFLSLFSFIERFSKFWFFLCVGWDGMALGRGRCVFTVDGLSTVACEWRVFCSFRKELLFSTRNIGWWVGGGFSNRDAPAFKYCDVEIIHQGRVLALYV